jgi:hypothetical protein
VTRRHTVYGPYFQTVDTVRHDGEHGCLVPLLWGVFVALCVTGGVLLAAASGVGS